MVERWVVVGAVAMIGCAGGIFGHAPLKPVADDRRLSTHTLPSGLRVVLDTERGSQRVAIALLVGTGSDADPVGREGLAHLLEHLAFRSRPTHQRFAWDELDLAGLASRGSSLSNAHTAFDATTFVGTTATARLPQVLPLMASLVLKPLESVDDSVLDVERRVVASERYDRDPHSGLQASQAIFATVLPEGAPGSRPVVGTNASLAAITRADLEAFVAQHYRPENVIVSLSGDFEAEAIGPLLMTAFPASWLQASPPRPPLHADGAVAARVLDPPPASSVRPVVESRVPLRRLVIAWAVPGEAVPSGLAMPEVTEALRRQVPRDLPGVKRSWVELLTRNEVSALAITAELEPDTRPDEVSAALRAKLHFGGVTPPPRNALLQLAEFEEVNLETRAERRANALFSTGRATPLEAGDEQLTATALKVVEAQVLTWDRARELLVQPLVRRVDATPPLTPPLDESSPTVRFPPEVLASVALGPPLGEVRRFTLSNGLNVLLSARNGAPVVSVALGLRARRADTSNEVATLLDDMIDWNGRQLRTPVPRPRVSVGADATVVNVSAHAEFLPVVLDLLGDNSSPRVAWAGDGRLEDAVKAIATTLDAPNPWRRLLERVMPAGSSALPGPPPEPGAPSFLAFAEFIDRAWKPDGASLVIDGSISLALTEEFVRDVFSHWRGRSPDSTRSIGEAPQRDARPKVIENQDAAVTTVRMACRLPPGRGARGLEPLAGNVLLAQALMKTLEDDLRQARGVTYGVTVDTTRFLDEANLLTVQLRLDPRDRQQGARRLLERLEELDGQLWSERDLELARWHVAKEGLGTKVDPLSVSAWLAGVTAAGAPIQAVFPRALATAPAHVVDDAWAACVETLAIELEGERSSLEALLSKRADPKTPAPP